MSDDISLLDACAQADLVRRGEVTPLELVDAAIARVERLNPSLTVLTHEQFETARETARRMADPSAREGRPFAGVPTLLKDLGAEEAGQPCGRGMGALREAPVEQVDSNVARRLKQAGMIVLGRTKTPELGMLPTTEPLAYGPARNPWNPDFSPGGSSGGAAAAVAARMVAVAHASDGGGSIRIPAAHCGLVGLKPSRGRVSAAPLAGERWGGFSTDHVVSHSVRDSAALLDVLAGPMPGDPHGLALPARSFLEDLGQPVRPLRIGLLTESPRPGVEVHADCSAAAEKAGRWLADLGHHVEPAWPEALSDHANVAAYVTIVSACTARALDAIGEFRGRPLADEEVEPLTAVVAAIGRAHPATRYLEAVETCHSLGRRLAAWWEGGYDLLLSPATGLPPPRLGDLVPDPDNPLDAFYRCSPYGLFTAAFNQSGQPAISLPVFLSADGLPIGVQLAASTGREDLLLQIAAQLEATHPWIQRRPPLPG